MAERKPHGTVAGLPFWFVPDQLCPKCGHRIDSAAAFSPSHAPQPGAGMFCGGCVTLLVFTNTLTLRLATPAELAAIEANARERGMFAFHRWFTEIGRDAQRRQGG